MTSAATNRTRALKVLVGVRERRGRTLEEAVDAALVRQDEAHTQEQAARQALVGALAAEAGERTKLLALTDAGCTFDIHMMVLREHVAETLKGKVVLQQQDVEQCGGVVTQCTHDVRSCRGEVARNRQKVQALKDDIAAVRAALQRADDDQQDEEAEETAISRMLQARASPETAETAS
jgi:hypothetical protein